MFLNQEHYIKGLVEEYGLEDGKTTGTPMQSNIKLVKSTPKESEQFRKRGLDYRSAIGSLNYLSQCTRPDITYAVGKLSQFLENPNDTHWTAFKRVVRYLKGSQDWGILYQAGSGHEIEGYVDSSWAEDDHSLSTSGYNFQCGRGLVSWRSKKLGGPSSSSTEAEYRAYLSASQEAQWLRKLTFDIHRAVSEKTKIWSDNQGAIQLAKNPVYHARTKHIGVHYNFTKDLVINKEIQIEYVPTDEMVADIFTKALDREKHTKFSSMMGLLPLSMIAPKARGCVEQRASASLCVLSTQSSASVTHDMSQEPSRIRSTELEIDDPRLPELQATEHAQHERMAQRYRREQYSRRKAAKQAKWSSQELAELLDANARDIEDKVKAGIGLNVRKRRRTAEQHAARKRKKVSSKSSRHFLSCFVLGHPWMIVRHIHKRRKEYK
jgi:hypothetical protein